MRVSIQHNGQVKYQAGFVGTEYHIIVMDCKH